MQVVKEGRCVSCGYDLGGLPRTGNCPECGHEYDDFTRAGFASNTAERQRILDQRMARARTGCFAFMAAFPMALALVVSLAGWGSPGPAFGIAFFFTLFFGLATVVSFLYEKPE